MHFINGRSLCLAQRILFTFLVQDRDRAIVLIDGHQSDACLSDLMFVFTPARVGPYIYMDPDRALTDFFGTTPEADDVTDPYRLVKLDGVHGDCHITVSSLALGLYFRGFFDHGEGHPAENITIGVGAFRKP